MTLTKAEKTLRRRQKWLDDKIDYRPELPGICWLKQESAAITTALKLIEAEKLRRIAKSH